MAYLFFQWRGFATGRSLIVSLSRNCILFLPVSDYFLHLTLHWHLIHLKRWKSRIFLFFFEVLIEMSLLNSSLTPGLSEVFWNIRDQKFYSEIEKSALDPLSFGYEISSHIPENLFLSVVVKAVRLQVGSPEGVNHESVKHEC